MKSLSCWTHFLSSKADFSDVNRMKSFPKEALGQRCDKSNFNEQPDEGFNGSKDSERIVKFDTAREKATSMK